MQAQQKVVFELEHYPVKDSSEKIFITGNFNNWVSDDKESVLINSAGKKQIMLSLEKGNYEYKFTRGDWSKGESDAKGNQVPNGSVKISGDTTILVSIAAGPIILIPLLFQKTFILHPKMCIFWIRLFTFRSWTAIAGSGFTALKITALLKSHTRLCICKTGKFSRRLKILLRRMGRG